MAFFQGIVYMKDKITFFYIISGILLIFLEIMQPLVTYAGWQMWLFVLGALLLGLPHGALDVAVAQKLKLFHGAGGMFSFVVVYLALAVLHYALWLALPLAAFLLFLALSVYHFGQDWQQAPLPLLRQLVFGLGFLLLPTFFHAEAVTFLFAWLIPPAEAALVTAILSAWRYPLLLLLLAFFLTDLWRRQAKMSAWATAVFIASGILLPPLLFLFLYFCLYHAPRHLLFLYQALQFTSVPHFLKSLWPVLLATLLLWLGLLWFRDQGLPVSAEAFATMLLLIAVLTTPHMLLVAYFSKHYQKSFSKSA
jgi:Brp/Blh family beta-carotene 15,15'-monooxygenase